MVRLWYPLYQCPKKIIDGCFPKYALQNYVACYQSHLYRRAVSQGVEYDLLRGYGNLSSKHAYVETNATAGPAHAIPLDDSRWKRFLGAV